MIGAGAASGRPSKKHSRRNVVPSLVDHDSRSYDNGLSSEVPGVGEALPPLGASDDRGTVMVTSGASGDAHVMDDRLRVGSFTGSDSSGADDTAALKLNHSTGGGIADDKAALELIPPKGGVVDESSSPGIRPDRDKRPQPPVKSPTERGLAAVHQGVKSVDRLVKKTNTWRAAVNEFLDDSNSSKGAAFFALFMTFAITASVLVFCVSTVPTWHRSYGDFFRISEMVFNMMFTIELVVRIYVSDSVLHVFEDAYLYFDCLAILPFWLEMIGIGGGPILSIVKACRMLRLLKLARQYQETIILVKAIRNSLYALGVPFFFLSVAVVLFASLLFYLENLELGEECSGDSNGRRLAANSTDEESNQCSGDFESIPTAVWFMIVTMTTVGYGDVSPSSTIGKFVASAAAVFGVLFLSMPLAIVGNNFTTIWGEKEKVIFLEKLKESVFKDGITPAKVTKIFGDMDTDGSGDMCFAEFQQFLDDMNVNLSLNEVRRLWNTIDEDHSGVISCDEFMSLIFNDDDVIVEDDEHQEMLLEEGGRQKSFTSNSGASGLLSGETKPISAEDLITDDMSVLQGQRIILGELLSVSAELKSLHKRVENVESRIQSHAW